MYPSGFKQYAAIEKAAGRTPDRKLARYAARYRLAGQISSLELSGYSQSLCDAYLHCLRISLAYSALESLEVHLGKHAISLTDEKIASKFKSPALSKFKVFALQESDPKLARRLEKFYSSENDSSLRPIVEVIRHTMFHGQLSPSASGLTTKIAIELLSSVEKLIFVNMDLRSKPLFDGAEKLERD